MSDSVYLGLKARQLEDSPEYQPISCVKLTIGGEDANSNPIVCQYPPDSTGGGRILETSNPLIWDVEIGNRVARNIHDTVKGYAYKPFTADGAIINPAVEIGDAVEVGDVYSVIADIETSFTPLMSANIAAPVGSDIDHEYPYESSENRELMQQLQGLKTSFIVENGRIAMEISDVKTIAEGAQKNVTSLELTVNGIHAYTDQEIKTISGGVVHDWAEINFTPENIKSQVSSYFDEAGAADGAYDAAEEYANRLVEPIAGEYTSAIEQSARDIKATVAASETIWNVYSLSQAEQNKFAVYGYGAPSDENSQSNKTRPSAFNGKYYLDQATGVYYRSNGSKWARQGQITEKLAVSQQSAIVQNANSIKTIVDDTIPGVYSDMSLIEQTAKSIRLSVSSDEWGQTTFSLTSNDATLDTQTLYLNVDAAHITGTIYANAVTAGATITSPYIYGGSISSGNFIGGAFMDANRDAYLSLFSAGNGAILYYGPNGLVQSADNAYFQVTGLGYNAAMYLGRGAFVLKSNGVYYPQGVWDFSNATVRGLPS